MRTNDTGEHDDAVIPSGAPILRATSQDEVDFTQSAIEPITYGWFRPEIYTFGHPSPLGLTLGQVVTTVHGICVSPESIDDLRLQLADPARNSFRVDLQPIAESASAVVQYMRWIPAERAAEIARRMSDAEKRAFPHNAA